MDNYIGLHQRHIAIDRESKLHFIEGVFMAIGIVTTPMIAVFVIGLLTGQ
jgi:hypothetical protein